MNVPENAKNELRLIYRQVTGENLNDHEAEEMARDLLMLFSVIYRPLPKSDGADQKQLD